MKIFQQGKIISKVVLLALCFRLVILTDLFVQVSEASVSRNRSTIIVPAGSARDEGWAAFRNILREINEASRLFILPNQVAWCSMHITIHYPIFLP